ncbi:hypothetical protein PYCH_00460 [Pyrococcus yayanosii CH1]|uniref:Uncharacterized protein n=1 Tax=Pyrococcus yayanosii (strain CH1 / JCM 16557) TaxID=529709 RepID=F8AFF2_PYRYC|nr:hypothetical protein PYCH_00460 [Pyrococcus yayanosii CH1]
MSLIGTSTFLVVISSGAALSILFESYWNTLTRTHTKSWLHLSILFESYWNSSLLAWVKEGKKAFNSL